MTLSVALGTRRPGAPASALWDERRRFTTFVTMTTLHGVTNNVREVFCPGLEGALFALRLKALRSQRVLLPPLNEGAERRGEIKNARAVLHPASCLDRDETFNCPSQPSAT